MRFLLAVASAIFILSLVSANLVFAEPTVERGLDYEKTEQLLDDGNVQGTIILGLPEWIKDETGKFVPAIYSESDDVIKIQSAQLSFIYDKETCSASMYEPGSSFSHDKIIIKSHSWGVDFAEVGSNNWNSIDFSGGRCDTNVIQNSDGITIEGKRIVDGGALRVEYKKSSGDPLESLAFFTNKDLTKINHKFAFIEKIVSVNNGITIDDKPLKIKNSPQPIKHNKVKDKEITFQSLNGNSFIYNFKQDDGLFANIDFQTTGDDTILNIAFRNVSDVPNPLGKTISIDPTFGFVSGDVFQLTVPAAFGATCSGPISMSSPGGFRIQKDASGANTFPCNLIAPRWDISSIPNSNIVDTVVRYDVDFSNNPPNNCDWKPIEARDPSILVPSEAPILWNDILNGLEYVDNSPDCNTVGTQKILDLGPDADNDLQNNLFNDWFAVGISFNDMTRDGTFHNVDFSNIQLQVDYLTAPTAPTLSASRISCNEIELNWTTPSDDGGSPIDGYFINRSVNSGGLTTFVADTGNTLTSYVDNTLSPGDTASYTVRALTLAGTSGFNSNFATASLCSVPHVTTNLAATAISETQIDLVWSVPSNGGSPITGYKIERESPTGNGFGILVADTGVTTTTYPDTGLTASTEYNYRVSAINAIGPGSVSNESSATTNVSLTAPSTVTDLAASVTSSTEIELSWTAPDNGGSPITGYAIEKRLNSGPWDTGFVSDTGTADTMYSDTTLSLGDTAHYRIKAINDIGVGGLSNTATVNIESFEDRVVGIWRNTDSSSGGNNYLQITEIASGLRVNAFERCMPSDCSLGNSMDTNADSEILSTSWDFSDRDIVMDITLDNIDDTKIRADTQITYPGFYPSSTIERSFVQTFIKTNLGTVSSQAIDAIGCFSDIEFTQGSYFVKDLAQIKLDNFVGPFSWNPTSQDNFYIQVWSDTDQEGVSEYMSETQVNSRSEFGFVAFEEINPPTDSVKVVERDYLYAKSCNIVTVQINDVASNSMTFRADVSPEFDHDYTLSITRDTDILLGNVSPVEYTVTIQNNSPPSDRHVAFHVLDFGVASSITPSNIDSSLFCWEPAAGFGKAVTCNINEMTPSQRETLTITHEPIEDHPQWSSGAVTQWFELTSANGDVHDTIVRVSTERVTDLGGGCLIATATFGSELAPQVQQLRELRDNHLLQTESGTSFMNSFNNFYYSFSPIIADYERENPMFKEIVKIAITPMISSLSILNYVDMDSEAEVLGYGISLIILNLGMYIGIPAIVIVGIRKKF